MSTNEFLPLPDQEYLREIFDYNYNTGELFWAFPHHHCHRQVGKRAGSLCKTSGYRQVGLDGLTYREHRIIWKWCNGTDPEGVIDHINGIRDDNRIENLRDVTQKENMWNKEIVDGQGGVLCKRAGDYLAILYVNGKRKFLGRFPIQKQAESVYRAAKEKYQKISGIPASQGRS